MKKDNLAVGKERGGKCFRNLDILQYIYIYVILTILYVLQLSEEKSEYFKFLNELVSWIPFNDRLVNWLIERLRFLDSLTD